MLKKIGQFLLGGIIFFVAIYGAFWWIAEPAKTHDYRSERPLIYAHQGGNGQWPDNTLYAFQRAVESGVDVLEMDVHATIDADLIVIHDATVNRTTNGSGMVKQMTLSEIQALDAAYYWQPDKNTDNYPLRGQGIRIPTLNEVFSTFPEARMNIEIKQTEPTITRLLCSLIQRHKRTDKTLVASFHTETIDAFREECPEVATGASSREVMTFYLLHRAWSSPLYSPVAQVLQVPEYSYGQHILTAEFVRDAHARNLAVTVWTVNDPKAMQRMIDLGVDGIITDYPERLMTLLQTGQ